MIKFNLQPAYVLNRVPYREQQYLLDLFTQDHGRIRASSRIPTKKTYRQTDLYAPFTKISLIGTRRYELASIKSAEIISQIPIAKKNLLSAYYVNELLLTLLPQDDTNTNLFKLYENTLGNLTTQSLRYFEYNLIRDLGLWPEIASQGNYYLISQHQNMPLFTASSSGFEASIVESLDKKQWPATHPQLKQLLQTIISIHGTRRQHSKKTAMALKQLMQR